MTGQKLKIMLVSAEVAPFAKVGGLADVAAALPRALQEQGHDVRIAMPAYQMVLEDFSTPIEHVSEAFPIPVRNDRIEMARYRRTSLAGSHPCSGNIPVYLIENIASGGSPAYFSEAVSSQSVYTYAAPPYIFFCRAILELIASGTLEWVPDVIHCNDWHTGLIPVFKSCFYSDASRLRDIATIFTIHNLAYQGVFSSNHWESTGLPWSLYHIDGLEFCGDWSFMKAGLLFADQVNTVSPTYAQEIRSPEYGAGLHGLMETLHRKGRLSGVLNRIDFIEYDPASDTRISARFDACAPKGKVHCKRALQEECRLPVDASIPVIGLITRLANQKGLDLIEAAAPSLLAAGAQFVVLGAGDPHYERFFAHLETCYTEQVRAYLTFDVELAQRIYAGSDLFLMPSRFEPCGMGQLIALRYGTIPVVRATGGLADTVRDFDPVGHPDGNGFVFEEYHSEALAATLLRALTTYRSGTDWDNLVRRVLRDDHSWIRSSEAYFELYVKAQSSRREQP